ncbi:MAG: type II toxin-antitoxin system HicA family toxin [Betaproteobacteria bacterium]|nr:type II toxin-antitoxin system HicA family toxin [Betaproteobacteria bacterium]
MKTKHRKTLADIFAVPVNGALEWSRIEALLIASGCRVVEGKGSAVAFHKDGYVFHTHRPHPGKEALRFRVLEARGFLEDIGVTP